MPFFKKNIQAIHPYIPGKPIQEVQREFGLRKVVKLASNENPLGPSRKAVRAMRRALDETSLYPEGSSHYLVKRLSEILRVPENQILIGNGSNEIIELLARGFLNDGDEVVSSEYSFLVYPILAQACGASYKAVPMKNYRYDLEALAKAVSEKTKIVFIANPNNPTGTYVTQKEMETFFSRIPSHVIVCLDEAYVDFVDAQDFPNTLELLKKYAEQIIIMRTFSKAHGLAGLRVGYSVASSEMTGYLHKIRQPFNVNSLAQVAATAALDDKFFMWRTKWLVSRGRKLFAKHLNKMGLEYLPSQANFVLIRTGIDADIVFKELLKKGMIIRSMKSYGLTDWIRVTIGRRSQNKQFFKLLEAFLSSRSS